jgi:transmembrane sensor
MTIAMTDSEESPADAATRWLVLLQSDDVTAEQRRRFAQWLAAHPSHLLAYRRLQQFWSALDDLPTAEAQVFDRLLSPSACLPPTAGRPPSTWFCGFANWQRYTALAVAVAVAAVCVVGIAQTWHLATYRTGTGEQRAVTLSDGSTIHLNTATALSTEFTSDVRRLVLHEGEAFFSVASDPERPFEVQARGGTIRALGTAFNVRTEGARVIVTVTQHAVRVSNARQAAADISEGHRVAYSPDEFGPVETIDPERTLAWRRHRLIFENQPLAQVIAELNRYHQGWIVLRDPFLQELPVTAVFDVRKTDQALRTIEDILPVRTVAVTDRFIWLFRSSSR